MTPPVLLRGGQVLDGTGSAARAADVLVDDGRVAAVEPGLTPAAADVLDCTGLVVSPGFVDLHSHADFTAPAWPGAETQLAQGVTTMVVGNCGFAPFPLGPLGADAVRRQAGFLAEPMAWDWHDATTYADAVDARSPAVNVVLQAGHHALRLATVGDAARPADAAEIADMGALLDTAADQGVGGFSTGLIYPPGRFADPAEITALAAVAARRGLLYSTHVRDETTHVVDAVAEAIEVAERTGARLEVSHLKAMGRAAHGSAPALLQLIDDARARGVDVAADVYPFTASSTTLASRLPSWALDGGVDGLRHRLADESARAQVADALRARMPAEVDPAGITIANLAPGPHASAVGTTLVEVGRRLAVDPADAALALLAEHAGTVSIVNHAMVDTDLDLILKHPWVSVASDGSILRPEPPADAAGLPHPRSFATVATVLGHYVRERGLLDPAEAVRKLSGLPASRIRLAGRGVLRPGAVADLAVWDASRVAPRATYTDPWHLATGVEHVLVGGVLAWREGAPTGRRPGRVLRLAASAVNQRGTSS